MSYLFSFLKIVIWLTLLILLYEVLLANYPYLAEAGAQVTISQLIDTSVSTVKSSVHQIVQLHPLNLKSISLAVWIFKYRFYYILIILVLLILYYKFKRDHLLPPTVTRKPIQSPGQYELNKQKLTQKSLKDLDEQLSKYYQNKQRYGLPPLSQENQETAKQLQKLTNTLYPDEP